MKNPISYDASSSFGDFIGNSSVQSKTKRQDKISTSAA